MKFFAPGRTEIIGNHTDHQRGRVIAASVSLGMSADVQPSSDGRMTITSQGFGEISVALDDLAPRAHEHGTPQALLRGMAAALQEAGFAPGGFSGQMESVLRPGGGLSSSAAFVILMGRILNGLYHANTIDPVTLARCGQQAENRHFGKPSGLMDQLACAMDGAVYIDFLSGEISPLEAPFAAMGLTLCLTDTGGSHESLTPAYAAIPADMRAEAARYGKELLGYVNYNDFLSATPRSDLAYARAKHFFEENQRVAEMREAMLCRDAAACMALMNASGRSSETLLQNIRAESGDDRLAQGLTLSCELLQGRGAWRVHGGGFAGCVQALLPKEDFDYYRAAMDARFGSGSCFEIM